MEWEKVALPMGASYREEEKEFRTTRTISLSFYSCLVPGSVTEWEPKLTVNS